MACAHSAHSLGVDPGIFRIDGDDHLEALLTLGDKLLGDLDQLFYGVLLQTEGDVGLHRILRAAEQAPNRFLIIFSFDVPERDVDGAHRRAPHAGLPARIELFVELVPDALGFERIFAAQKGREFAIDEFLHAEALRAARETVAGHSLVGFDAGKQDRGDDFFFEQRHFNRHPVQRGFDVGNLQNPPPISRRCQLAWISRGKSNHLPAIALLARMQNSY